MLFTLENLFILIKIKETFWLTSIIDLEQPTFFGLLVNQSWILFNFFIDGRNFPSDRSIHISCNFDTLNDSCTCVLFILRSHMRKLNMNDLPELILSMIGYSYSSSFAFREELYPLVAFGKFKAYIKRADTSKKSTNSKT